MRLIVSLLSVAWLAACAAATPAPVVYGRGATQVAPQDGPPQDGPRQDRPPQGGLPQDGSPQATARGARGQAFTVGSPTVAAPIVRMGHAPPELQSAPRPQPVASAPDWAAGPGTPLSAYALQPDQAAPFDPAALPRSHRVVAGDTLYGLSVRYQIALRPLIEANGLDAPFTLAVGQTLALPPPRRHLVVRGETLMSLARQFNIDARSLALLNRLVKPYAVRVGETLVLPALARAEASSAPARPATGPTRFAWPLVGPILTRFGPQSGGRRSDGVDIAAGEGAEVKAAGDGRVVYAGDDLSGYGHLMLVQHAGGWITAYAHCASFTVKEGDRVHQGQKLGLVGKTATGESKLHFQIRRGATPTDPLASLPAP